MYESEENNHKLDRYGKVYMLHNYLKNVANKMKKIRSILKEKLTDIRRVRASIYIHHILCYLNSSYV